ncbi:MAG TPA: peptidylprolyl isomerase [Bryobacteraceae bacterium]|nr:peptidylprolyl isomerase [Bryobacteraceae bacterium]
MKSLVLAVLFSVLLCAQLPQPVQVTPGTPAVKAPAAPASPAPPAVVKPDTVVMTSDGKKYTAAEVDRMIAILPPQYQQSARTPQMLTTLLIYKKMAEDAVKEGYDQASPYKEQLEFARLQILTQAELTLHGNALPVSQEDQEKYYKEHPDRFQDAKVAVIYIAFNPAPDKTGPDGKKLLTEAEAKAKIDDLRKQIAGGADFGKLARDNSNDPSATKDGQFGSIKHSSPYPDAIKSAVFALKPGELSQPIRQPNGFWLIRLDAMQTESYEEAASQIFQQLKQERMTEWTKALQAQFAVKVEEPAYFAPKVPAQLQQVR